MASVSKSFLADAGYGEQELDANSALMELDKGKWGGRGRRTHGNMCACVDNVVTSHSIKEVPPRVALSVIDVLGQLCRRMELL